MIGVAERGHSKSWKVAFHLPAIFVWGLYEERGFSYYAAQYIIEIYHLPWLPSQWFGFRWYESSRIPIQVGIDDTHTHIVFVSSAHIFLSTWVQETQVMCWGWRRCNSIHVGDCLILPAYSLHLLKASLLEKTAICRQAHLKGLFCFGCWKL